MKILLMTGSYPPDICGVADYTERLAESLRHAGIEVSILTGMRWNGTNVLRLNEQIEARGADILHMQYPTTGYGWHVGPQLVSLLKPFVITIHECSQSHVFRRLSLYPFSLRAPYVIFTNEYERRYASGFAPWITHKSTVIPIGSNVCTSRVEVMRAPNVVTYFGLIRPLKGLEQVIRFARQCRNRNNGLSVRVVGTVLPGNEAYHATLVREAEDLAIEWKLGLQGDNLSRVLAGAEIAYLPFPDGASERRGSLIAMLESGAAVITTRGPHTPPSMDNVVDFASSAQEAVDAAEALFRDPLRRSKRRNAGLEYAARFSWESIASQHVALYERLRAAAT